MLPAGSRVGDYEIEADLGEGGMARVYRARHTVLDTHHALKVLDPELRANAEARQRFLDEARIQAKHLDHEGIVKVTNIVATPDHAALVMELIDGGSLDGAASSLRGNPDEIKRIMIAVLDAVGHAHAAGIVHRDLKPANVLLARRGDQLVPKVTDFGIAKVTASAGRTKKSTHAATRMGTLSYMSPEQIRRAKDVTARSDVFSLGAMLYEIATGALPFDADSDYDVMEQIVNARYVPPAQREPRIDPVIARVIERALQPDPERRYASCAEMADALRAGGPPAVVAARPPRAGRGLMIAGVVLAVGALGTGVAVYLTRAREPSAPDALPPLRLGLSAPDAGALVDSPVEGASDAAVTLVVGDNYVNAEARLAQPVLAALLARYPSQLRIVYKHLDVVFEEYLARPLARGACAAHRQGRHAVFRRALFARPNPDYGFDRSQLVELAGDVGLDADRFEQDFDGVECAIQIVADDESFADLQVSRAPAYIIAGRVVVGARTVDDLSAMIDEAIAGTNQVAPGWIVDEVGMLVNDVQRGLGPRPTDASSIEVHYSLWLWENGARGRKIQSSYDQGRPETFEVSRLTPGFQRGVLGMHVGGTRQLWIPPAVHDVQGRPGIPADATLLYEIELRAIR